MRLKREETEWILHFVVPSTVNRYERQRYIIMESDPSIGSIFWVGEMRQNHMQTKRTEWKKAHARLLANVLRLVRSAMALRFWASLP